MEKVWTVHYRRLIPPREGEARHAWSSERYQENYISFRTEGQADELVKELRANPLVVEVGVEEIELGD